ncbi:RodZ domain-containing protein [Pseudidiomarina homiensis]|uniref:RodZ domain-containing protein n=1 Tax=Pseudidiomarina homiensis TaxID=364198 RepID=UPI00215A8AF8|nr:RodZ domain-containing protein [Pseudidiomarina homiensis]
MTSNKDLLNDELPEEGNQKSNPTGHTPGQILAQAREQKGLSQQQVADSLRLRLAVVQLIEADEYEQLASNTFVRGYLRAIAKALEIDDKKVFEAFKEHGYDTQQTSNVQMQSFSRRKVRERNDSRLKWISYIIITVVLALVLIWWWQESNFSLNTITGSEDAPTEAEAKQERATVQNIPQIVRPSPSQITEEQAVARNTSTEPDEPRSSTADPATDTTAAEPDTTEPDVARSSTAGPTTDITDAEPAEPEPTPAEQLVFEFNQACWVKVSDATGEDIAIGVKAAGYRMPLTGEPPFDIILCKPEAVTLTYNGENVNLDDYVRNRSVTLTLD